jgi:hypothetical protein
MYRHLTLLCNYFFQHSQWHLLQFVFSLSKMHQTQPWQTFHVTNRKMQSILYSLFDSVLLECYQQAAICRPPFDCLIAVLTSKEIDPDTNKTAERISVCAVSLHPQFPFFQSVQCRYTHSFHSFSLCSVVTHTVSFLGSVALLLRFHKLCDPQSSPVILCFAP